MQPNKPTSLFNNSRFYVLAFTVCLSIFLFLILLTTIADSRLRYIRLQQWYGLLAVVYWYSVLMMSAGSKVIGKKPWIPAVLFTRRALGVSVAYFAVLHFYLAITHQLNGVQGILMLPLIFKWALAFAAVTLTVLLVMAALSIDKVVALVKFRHWKVLSRISYGAALLIILHIWMIGTHVSSPLLQLLVFQALVVLFGLEAWRLSNAFRAKGMKPAKANAAGVAIFLVLSGMLIAVRMYVPSYSRNHQDHITETGAEHGH